MIYFLIYMRVNTYTLMHVKTELFEIFQKLDALTWCKMMPDKISPVNLVGSEALLNYYAYSATWQFFWQNIALPLWVCTATAFDLSKTKCSVEMEISSRQQD